MIASEAEARAFVAQRCDSPSMERLERFVSMLRDENAAQNLVSAPSLASVWQRHIADSAQLLDLAPENPGPAWLDLGTGAGFPGLVIAIMRPGWQVALVEPRKRRVEWLRGCVAALEIDHCRVLGARIEAVETFAAGVISARAVASLDKLVAIAARFSTSDTTWLLPKGRSAAQEITSLPNRLRTMFHVEHSVTDSEAGIVVGSGMEMKP